MKKQVFVYLMAASVAATAGFAQSQKSVSDIDSLSASFQSAVDSTDTVFFILKSAYSETQSLNSSARQLVSDARLLSYKTERAKFEFERLKSDFSKPENADYSHSRDSGDCRENESGGIEQPGRQLPRPTLF